MKIDITQAITILASIWAWVIGKKALWQYISKLAEPLVKKAEQLALDGKLDKADKKELALDLLAELEKSGKVKLNFFTRFFVNKAIDIIAKKLPDFTIAQDIEKLGNNKALEIRTKKVISPKPD